MKGDSAPAKKKQKVSQVGLKMDKVDKPKKKKSKMKAVKNKTLLSFGEDE